MKSVKTNDYVMPFGKYKGCYLSDIYSEDNRYFRWLEEVQNLPEDLIKAIQDIKEN